MKKLKGSAGFSLIEVVAATAVIGMLAAMVIPSLNGVYEKAHDAKLANDMATIDSAIVLYKMDKGELPGDLEDLVEEKYLTDNDSLKDYTYQTTTSENSVTYKLTGKDADGQDVISNGSTEKQN